MLTSHGMMSMVILLRMQRIGEFMLGRTWLLRRQGGGRREREYHSHAHLLELEKLKLLSLSSLNTGEVAVGLPPVSNRLTEIGVGDRVEHARSAELKVSSESH